MSITLTNAYAKQHNGNWSPLTVAVTLEGVPDGIQPLPTSNTLQVWLGWADAEKIMAAVATQPERIGNWATLIDGGGLPDVGVYAVDQWGRNYSSDISRVHAGRGVLISMRQI